MFIFLAYMAEIYMVFRIVRDLDLLTLDVFYHFISKFTFRPI